MVAHWVARMPRSSMQVRRAVAMGLIAMGLALGAGQIEANLSSDATTLAAEDKDKDKDKDKIKEKDVNPAATPELGSIALFGAGAVGMAGYVMTRFKAASRRKQQG